jgi:hypothetical protein
VFRASRIAGPSVCASLTAAALSLLLVAPGLALEGKLADERGRPIPGGRICYTAAHVELLCAETDAEGHWVLPDSELDQLRISADGFLPQEVPAVPRDKPITLKTAATLLVRLVDARTGEGLDKGIGEVVFPSGRQRRFVTNRAGARVKSLESDTVSVTARVDGYAPGGPEIVELKAGQEIELEIRLEPAPGPADEATNPQAADY